MIKRLIKLAYQELVLKRRREVAFWVLLSFTVTFSTARLLVHFAPSLFLNVHGSHIHHFTYGIILLAVSGFIALTKKGRSPSWLSVLYGVGLGLALTNSACVSILQATILWRFIRNEFHI
jgi:hypothetical protein